MASTGFLITQVGLASAATANPGGPYININQFRVGSGVSYTPPGYVEGVSPTTQTGLVGTTLYTGVPIGHTVIDADTIEVTLLIPSTTTSFDFGEIGIYLNTGVLFAICVFDTLQRHERAVGNQAGTNWRIRARLRLTQIPAICNVTLQVNQNLLEVPNWQSLIRPDSQPTGANAAIVHDNNSSNEPVLVVRDADTEWGIVGYSRVFDATIGASGSTVTTTQYFHPDLSSVALDLPETTSKYLIKFPNGAIRKITARIDSDTVTWAPALGALPGAGNVQIFQENGLQQRISWADTQEYNAFVVQLNAYWGPPTGTFPGSNLGLNENFLPIISDRRVNLADWTLVFNALRALCAIHGVSTVGINVDTDFIYNPIGTAPYGMVYYATLWENLNAKLTEQAIARLTFNPAFQESQVYPIESYSPYFAIRNFEFTFNYSSDNHRRGLLNGGHQLALVLNVNTPVDPSWVQLDNLFTQIGTIFFYDGEVAISGAGNGTLNLHVGTSGLHRLDPTFRSQLTISDATSGWRVTIVARLVSEDILIRVTIDDTIAPGVYAGSPGTVTFQWTSTRPSSTIVNAPVLAFPSMTFASS